MTRILPVISSGVLCLILIGGSVAPEVYAAAPVDLSEHVLVAVGNEQTTLDRDTGILTSTVDVKLHNLGGRTLLSPLHAAIELDSPEVQVPGALGGPTDTTYGTYYLDLSAQLAGGRLDPGSSVQFALTLVRDRTVDFSYHIRPYSTVETNLPPEVQVDPLIYTVTEGDTLNVSVTATDPDGEPVTLAGEPMMDHALFQPSNGVMAAGTFAFAPERGQRGHCLVTFTARDPSGNKDQETIRITVLPNNGPPTIDVPESVELDEGALVTIPVNAADPDGDTVTVESGPLPDNAVFIGASLAVTFAPDYDQAGEYDFEFRASDGVLSSGVATVHITVHDVVGTPGDTNQVVLTVEPPESPTLTDRTVIRGTVNADLRLPPAQQIASSLIVGLDPVNARQGETLTVMLTGKSAGLFVPRWIDGVSVADFGQGIDVESLTVTSPTEAVADIRIGPAALIGVRGVQVRTGSGTALAVPAFVVQRGMTQVSGILVDEDTGLPIAGATVLVEGTLVSAVTGADGSFTLSGVPTGRRTVIINAGNHKLIKMTVEVAVAQALDVGNIGSKATVFIAGSPASKSVMSVLQRGIGELSGRVEAEDARDAVRDVLLLLGGTEAGVLDEYGNQLSDQISGVGLFSTRHKGVSYYADRLARAESVQLIELLFDLSNGLEWDNGDPPSFLEWLGALQQIVNAAWADPTAPESAVPIAVFNTGRSLTPDPPVLDDAKRLTRLQAYIFVSGLFTAMYNHQADWDTSVAPRPVGRSGGAGTDGSFAGTWAEVVGLLDDTPVGGSSAFVAGDDTARKEFEDIISTYYTDGSQVSQEAAREALLEAAINSPEAQALLAGDDFLLEQVLDGFDDLSRVDSTLGDEMRRLTDTSGTDSAPLWMAADVSEGPSFWYPFQGMSIHPELRTRIYKRSQSLTAPRIVDGRETLVELDAQVAGTATTVGIPVADITFTLSGRDNWPDTNTAQFVYRLWRTESTASIASDDYTNRTQGVLSLVAAGTQGSAKPLSPQPVGDPGQRRLRFRIPLPPPGLNLYYVDCLRVDPSIVDQVLTNVEALARLNAFFSGFIDSPVALTENAVALGTGGYGLQPGAAMLLNTEVQVSALSEGRAVFISGRTSEALRGNAVHVGVHPRDPIVYVAVPGAGEEDRATGLLLGYDARDGSWQTLRQPLFIQPGPRGAAVDPSGYFYSVNGGSQAAYGGRVVRFRTDGISGSPPQEIIGSYHYFSHVVGSTRPTDITGIAFGPRLAGLRGPALFMADRLSQEIRFLDSQGNFISAGDVANHNVGQSWARVTPTTIAPTGATLNIRFSSRIAASADGQHVYVTQGNRVVDVTRGADNAQWITREGGLFTSAFGCETCSSRSGDVLFVSDQLQGRIYRFPVDDFPIVLPTDPAEREQYIQRYIFLEGLQRPAEIAIGEEGRGLAIADDSGLFYVRFGFSGSAEDPDGNPLPGAVVTLTMPDGSETTTADAEGRFSFEGISDRSAGTLHVNHPRHSYSEVLAIDWKCAPALRPTPCVVIDSPAEGSIVTSELVTVHGEIFPRSFDFSISGGNLEVSGTSGSQLYPLDFTGADNQFLVSGVLLEEGDNFLRAITYSVGTYQSGVNVPARITRQAALPDVQAVGGILADDNGNPMPGARVRILVDGALQDVVPADGCGYYHADGLPLGTVTTEVEPP